MVVPHKAPLHPLPDKLQDRTVLGFDPGTGLSVAIKVAVEDAAPLMAPPVAAENCW
jgi:hypothetical protein